MTISDIFADAQAIEQKVLAALTQGQQIAKAVQDLQTGITAGDIAAVGKMVEELVPATTLYVEGGLVVLKGLQAIDAKMRSATPEEIEAMMGKNENPNSPDFSKGSE